MPDDCGARVLSLPSIKVASVVHRGALDDIERLYEDLVRWIEDSGNHPAGEAASFATNGIAIIPNGVSRNCKSQSRREPGQSR